MVKKYPKVRFLAKSDAIHSNLKNFKKYVKFADIPSNWNVICKKIMFLLLSTYERYVRQNSSNREEI